MATAEPAAVPMFTPEALVVLDRQAFDPLAKASYELMSGGLVWPDELPRPGSPERAPVLLNWAHRYLLAYRAALTLGEASPFRPVWEQVMAFAPNWPGLRPERRGEEARKRLLAAKRREAVCLDALEKEFDGQRGGA
jgi:hypothetical protein